MSYNQSVAYNLRGALEVAVTLPFAPVLRARYNQWGATTAEHQAIYPGDAYVPNPLMQYTRAITIQATASKIWPWLVQIGYGRAGLYSYDGLENIAGCDLHSADTLLDVAPLTVGDLMQMGPENYPSMYVLSLKEARYLLLGNSDDITSADDCHTLDLSHPPAAGMTRSTWLFYLQPQAHGQTRLIVRQRMTFPPKTMLHVMWGIVEPLNFVMERAMLRGIKRRAEQSI